MENLKKDLQLIIEPEKHNLQLFQTTKERINKAMDAAKTHQYTEAIRIIKKYKTTNALEKYLINADKNTNLNNLLKSTYDDIQKKVYTKEKQKTLLLYLNDQKILSYNFKQLDYANKKILKRWLEINNLKEKSDMSLKDCVHYYYQQCTLIDQTHKIHEYNYKKYSDWINKGQFKNLIDGCNDNRISQKICETIFDYKNKTNDNIT